MARVLTSLKYGSFVYDFTIDGGAVGTKQMGTFLPNNCVVWFGFADVITTVTSSGAAKISIGIAGAINNLLFNTTYTSFTTNAIIPGIDLLASPVLIAIGGQLNITVVDFALTAGKLIYWYAYTDSSIVFPVPQGIGAMIIGSTFIVG